MFVLPPCDCTFSRNCSNTGLRLNQSSRCPSDSLRAPRLFCATLKYAAAATYRWRTSRISASSFFRKIGPSLFWNSLGADGSISRALYFPFANFSMKRFQPSLSISVSKASLSLPARSTSFVPPSLFGTSHLELVSFLHFSFASRADLLVVFYGLVPRRVSRRAPRIF